MISLTYGLFIKLAFGGTWLFAQDGAIAGTAGKGIMTDAFQIYGFPFPVEYRIHVQDNGWLPWVPAEKGQFSTGLGKRLEAVEFRFPRGIPDNISIFARVHLGDIGWKDIVQLQNGVVLGTVGESRRLEGIQIIAGETAIAGELKKTLDEDTKANLSGVQVRVLPGNANKAYRIAPGMSVKVESLIGVPAASEPVTIVCGGSFPLYYHTEGNPPGLGDNDNGVIKPGTRSEFKITAATLFSPDVYVEANQGGPVECIVFIGPMNLHTVNVLPSDGPGIIDYIKHLFDPPTVPKPPNNIHIPVNTPTPIPANP